MLPAATGFQSSRASFVALSSITSLALALFTSLWLADASGSVALLGLFSVYAASTEVLFLVRR